MQMKEFPIYSVNDSAFNANAKFSILVPSWNNLPYLKLCIESLRKNSVFEHQILVFVNEGNDGTREWLALQVDISYVLCDENVGVCYALNILSGLASTDYIAYMNDDMYACPKWDQYLFDDILSIGHKYFFISGTAIERVPQSVCSIEGNFGNNIESFEEKRLLKSYADAPMQDWNGATWPPNIVHKDIWALVGGYSIEFSPGMYSDPDFSMKLWQAGVRYFKGIAASRVYHFGSLSVKRVKRNRGYHTFISKWGMTSSTFSKIILKRGTPFEGVMNDSYSLSNSTIIKNYYKQIIAIFKR